MALEKYKAKRNFKNTSEPPPKVARKGGRRFVVQEHHASRLHYDFRLEMDGVLKSWAVPKGPSLNPADKRLAVMVEDHPVDYLDFQGHIEEGNYGAGDVAVWDIGNYDSIEGEGSAGIRNGKLVVRLNGSKLHGEFHMVRLKDSENQWLLIKGKDEYADADWHLEPMLLEANGKVETGKGRVAPKIVRLAKPEPKPPAGKKAAMPDAISPMLATLVDELPPGDDYLYEQKWDGFRAIAFIKDGSVSLISRNHNDLSPRFPEMIEALRLLPVRQAILDGEIVALDGSGSPSFQALQNRTGIKTRATKKDAPAPVVYYGFDLLYLNGIDFSAATIEDRRSELEQLLSTKRSDLLRFSESVSGAKAGALLFEEARKAGLEGIVAKQLGSKYTPRRSPQWLKLKVSLRQEAVIGGYTEPRHSRKHFGALVLGLYEGKELHYVGHTGGGFNTKALDQTFERMHALETDTCPFSTQPHTNEAAHWVEPELVCEVNFSEWTSDGRMRHPIFMGLRDDKKPRDCHREQSHKIAAVTRDNKKKSASMDIDELMNGDLAGDATVRIGEAQVSLTHLDKVYWPDDGFTKGDLLRYYYNIANYILPHLRDRPLILQRFPNGIAGKPFYQHDIDKPPPFLQTWEIQESTGNVRYALADSVASLLYVVNLGAIAQHPWNSRIGNLDHPDWIVFDLDPEGVPYRECCNVALTIRDALKKIGLECHAKTSGSEGLHVYVPFAAEYSYEQLLDFAKLVAGVIESRHVGMVTQERMRAKRPKRHIYLDCLQNERGKSVASVYSVRAHSGATVSAPLKWAWVEKGVDPADYTIENMPALLSRDGDLFEDVLSGSQRLEPALPHLEDLLREDIKRPQPSKRRKTS